MSHIGSGIGRALAGGLGSLFGTSDISELGSRLGSSLGGLASLAAAAICRPLSDNSVIRTVGLGSIGGQQTQEYELFKSDVGSRVLNAAHLHMDINALQVLVQGKLEYVQTGWLFAIIVFDEPKQKAGQLLPWTLQESENTGEEEARIYEGAGYVVWTRTGTVDGVMTREEIDLIIKNQDDFRVQLKKGSRISLLASLYTNFEDPSLSLNYESAIMIGKLEFNIISLKEEAMLL